jgi:hypothetical protein
MKNNRLSYLLIFAVVWAFPSFISCKKCVTCKAYDRNNNSVMSEEDYCGPKVETDEAEKNYIYIWNNTQTFAECK